MAEKVQHLKSATTIFLDQPPSCLEFCPEVPDHFVVGTYLLSETKNEDGEIQQSKTGSLQLWKLDPITDSL
jgi:diphthamide biosynthesis protein 7